MLIKDLENKKILILGFGREGQDTFLFLRKEFPEKMIGIADKLEQEKFPRETQELFRKDKAVVLHLGDEYLKAIKKYDVVIKTPGIPLEFLKPFLGKNQILTSQTNIFFEHCPGMIIGITGTKGKSTTSTLIYEVLKNGGVSAHLIGNIEKPVLQFLSHASAHDVFVYELSSFQLELLHKSPHIAVFLNLYPEHLDHHGSFQNYREAKTHITKFQSKEDYLVFNREDPNVRKIALKSKARKIPFQPLKKRNASFVASVQPAIIIGKIFKIPKGEINEAIRNFRPLPHRLEGVGKYRGITFINDSLATIPEATQAALSVLGKEVQTLILGGFDRGISFHTLAESILASSVKTVILFPTTGQRVWQEVEKLAKKIPPKRLPQRFFVDQMEAAIRLCYEHTEKGNICLLSPASPSFTSFRDYKDRGDQFKKFVAMYGKQSAS